MWSLLQRRMQLAIIVSLTLVAVWFLNSVYELGAGHNAPPLKWVGLITTIIGGGIATAVSLMWRKLWRWFPALNQLVFPDLNGVWPGHLRSTYIDPATGQQIAPIATTVTIRQSLFRLSVKLKTGESTSYSTREFLEAFRDEGRFRLWYSYNNDPKAQVQHRSSPHEGVAYLETVGAPMSGRLEGRYYTARKTTGDMVLNRAVCATSHKACFRAGRDESGAGAYLKPPQTLRRVRRDLPPDS